MLNDYCSTKQKQATIPIQKALFGPDQYLANAQQKMTELYQNNPNIAQSEKRAILEYWKTYDGLSEVLGDKVTQFTAWFIKATSNETITRCLRLLKQDGTIKLNPDQLQKRQERQQQYRSYFGNSGG